MFLENMTFWIIIRKVIFHKQSFICIRKKYQTTDVSYVLLTKDS